MKDAIWKLESTVLRGLFAGLRMGNGMARNIVYRDGNGDGVHKCSSVHVARQLGLRLNVIYVSIHPRRFSLWVIYWSTVGFNEQ